MSTQYSTLKSPIMGSVQLQAGVLPMIWHDAMCRSRLGGTALWRCARMLLTADTMPRCACVIHCVFCACMYEHGHDLAR